MIRIQIQYNLLSLSFLHHLGLMLSAYRLGARQ